MAELPRYQRIGLQTRQPQQMDFAATREQAKLGQTITQQVNRMSDFAFKQGAQAAEIRGQERVRDEGARPTLEAIQEGGGPSTIAERTAYALGSRVAVAEIQNEAELEISKILNNAERNQTSFTAVQAQLADIKDGYSASLNAIDPEAAIMLQTRLSSGIAKAESRYSNYYVKMQASRVGAKVNTAADVQLESVLANAILPGSGPSTIKDNIAESVDLLIGLGANEKTIQSFKEQTYDAAIKENTIFKFNSSDLNTQAEMLTSMETKPVEGMSLEQTQTFRKSLRADYNSKLNVAKGEAASVISDVNELSRVLALGGMPSAKDVLTLSQRADNAGDFGAGARDAIGTLKFNMEKAGAFRKMTPEDLAAEVEALSQGLEGMAGPGVDTLIEAETLKTAKAYLKSAKQAEKAADTAQKKMFKPVVEAFEKQVKDTQTLVNSGKPTDVANITKLIRSIAELPDDLKGDLPDDVMALFITNKTVSDLQGMTPSEATGYINALYEGIDGFKDPGIDTTLELQTYDLAKKMYSGMVTELKKDPLGYAARVGLSDLNGNAIEITPINLTDPDATFETIRKRVNDANIVASKYSTPVTYFTPDEKSMLTEIIDGADRAQKMYILGAIVDAGAQAAPDMLVEISKTAPEFAGIGALVVNEKQDTATSALRGMDKLKGGYKIPEFTPTNTDLKFNEMTTSALRFMPNTIGITRSVAKAIYADMASANNLTDFNEVLWESSINKALGADGFGNGGIQDVRGIPTYVPAELNADDIEVALKGITPSTLAAASNGQIITEAFSKTLSGYRLRRDNDYQLVSQGGDNYVMVYGDADVPAPIYASDEDDNLIVLDIKKLVEATKLAEAAK